MRRGTAAGLWRAAAGDEWPDATGESFERLTIEAAVHGCRDSALLALVTNPLVGNVTDAQALLDEVLTINRQWLTQFN
jgi:6-phospho-beta-glucosidase